MKGIQISEMGVESQSNSIIDDKDDISIRQNQHMSDIEEQTEKSQSTSTRTSEIPTPKFDLSAIPVEK